MQDEAVGDERQKQRPEAQLDSEASDEQTKQEKTESRRMESTWEH